MILWLAVHEETCIVIYGSHDRDAVNNFINEMLDEDLEEHKDLILAQAVCADPRVVNPFDLNEVQPWKG